MRNPSRAALLGVLLAALAGCARPGGALPREPLALLERAIQARGGALVAASRVSQVDAQAVVPGRWRWEIAWRSPESFRFTLLVQGDLDQHTSFDGKTLRSFLGGAPISTSPAARASFRTHARFQRVFALDGLRDADVALVAVASDELRRGEAAALGVRFATSGEAYRLGFDAGGRLLGLAGPVVLPGAGRVQLEARYADFRRVDGYRLPFAASYTADGRPLAEERVEHWAPNDPRLDAESFRRAPDPTQRPGRRR